MSGNDDGVHGVSRSAFHSGVFGKNEGGGYGVVGQTTADNAIAVRGANFGGGPGVLGSTGSDTSSGVWGINSGAGPGVRGTALGTGFAGLFEGAVYITGDFNVGGAKNAV